MKALCYIVLVIAVACCVPAASSRPSTTPAPIAAAPTPSIVVVTRNLAVDFVGAIEPDAKCVAYYSGEGPTLTHSTVCRLPNKTRVYCSLSSDKTPGCVVVEDPRPQPPQPQPPVAAPAPAAPAPAKRAPAKGP